MESFEAYLTDTKEQLQEALQACWDLGVAVYSAEPYNRTFINKALVGQDANGKDVFDGKYMNMWQDPLYDEGINKWYERSATEFNYSQPRQDALLAIIQSFPSVEIVPNFVPTEEEV